MSDTRIARRRLAAASLQDRRREHWRNYIMMRADRQTTVLSSVQHRLCELCHFRAQMQVVARGDALLPFRA